MTAQLFLHAASTSSECYPWSAASAMTPVCYIAIAAGDAMWQRAGLSVGCLVNALRAHRDALAAGGRIPTALDSATAWAWQTETPPPAGSALAALRHYAVELLAAFRCVATGRRCGSGIWISHSCRAAPVIRICTLVRDPWRASCVRAPSTVNLHVARPGGPFSLVRLSPCVP